MNTTISDKTTLRRVDDIIDESSKTHIVRLAFLLASILIILASVSLVFVGRFASDEADRQAAANQKALLKTALEDRFLLIARDQLSLARWDQSVRNISLHFDREFVTDEFIDSLWYDFGLDRNLLIGPDNHILTDAYENNVSFDTGKMSPDAPLYRLVELARERYFQNRRQLHQGYGQYPTPLIDEFIHPVHGFIEENNKVALVHAMAVVPDDGEVVLPDGNPVVLISTMHIDQDLVDELGRQLAFSGIHFDRSPTEPDQANSYTILSLTDKPLGTFTWQADLPGGHIWNTVIPVIVILGAILSTVAFVIAGKISRLTLSLARSEEQNRHLAMFDVLSGLANRLQYTRALSSAFEKLPATPFALMQCDLDKFKQVNDSFGHGAGDIVIKVVANRLLDEVQSAGLVCRIGGDEFVVILNLVDKEAITNLAMRIIDRIRQPIEVEPGISARVGISLGVSLAPEQGDSPEVLMASADTALYRAKEEGRNRVIFAESRAIWPAYLQDTGSVVHH